MAIPIYKVLLYFVIYVHVCMNCAVAAVEAAKGSDGKVVSETAGLPV